MNLDADFSSRNQDAGRSSWLPPSEGYWRNITAAWRKGLLQKLKWRQRRNHWRRTNRWSYTTNVKITLLYDDFYLEAHTCQTPVNELKRIDYRDGIRGDLRAGGRLSQTKEACRIAANFNVAHREIDSQEPEGNWKKVLWWENGKMTELLRIRIYWYIQISTAWNYRHTMRSYCFQRSCQQRRLAHRLLYRV